MPIKTLDKIFRPKRIALIGVSNNPDSVAGIALKNLVGGGFQGVVYPINPKYEAVMGITCYPDVKSVPKIPDLAVIMTAAKLVPKLVRECGEAGIHGIIIMSAGFKEAGEEGKALEKQIKEEKSKFPDMRIIGPNCLGILVPGLSMNASFANGMPEKGHVAFISQSGNLGNQLIHWAEQQGIGISLFVGSGNEAQLTCNDYLEYLERDPHTRIIVLYLESVANGNEFIDTAKRINREKPVIVLKGGRTDAGKAAAASHTGSMSGENAVFRAACRQAGILDVRVPSELLDLSAAFSSLPLPKGNRVGIVTLGGGWGVVTADECNERGLQVPRLPHGLIESIGEHLPPFWSRGNPVDLVGTRDMEAPLVAVEELLKWEGIDAVICLGIVGRNEFVRQLTRSTRDVDEQASPEFLTSIEKLSHEYEEGFVTKTVELMEAYEKPVIGVSLSRTDKGTVRFLPGKRYSGVFYQTPENAVNALARMVDHTRFSRFHSS